MGISAEMVDPVEIIELDYAMKVKMLETIAQQLIHMQAEFALISGRHAELRANLQVLKEVKGALQSAIRAEMSG